ncbi:MAG: hypothetical protein IPL88_00640 [Rhizobiales bacterium]|nr:hypothetical protein [Hyphomicrobiales bacterium]
MIRLIDAGKEFRRTRKVVRVLDDVTADFRADVALGVLARPGQGKSTLAQILCGAKSLDSGAIERGSSISFPLGYAGWLTYELTAAENIAFMARLYGRDVDEMIDQVFDFAGLRRGADEPLRYTTPVHRTKVAYGVSFALDFDIQLVDEAIGVGDVRFRAKCLQLLQDKAQKAGVIAMGSNWTVLDRFCDAAATLHHGRIEFFPTLQEASDYLNRIAPE